MKHIGQRRRAIDWQARTAGTLAYTADLHFDGLLHARVLRSPHPHARIVALDVEAARRLPGVHAVITARDFAPGMRYLHEGAADRPPLADGVVRFVGQEVAAVAAESTAQADAALAAIVVRYERLAPALTLAAAQAPGGGRLHDRPTQRRNISKRLSRRWGAQAPARNAADSVTARGRFAVPRQFHACMETHVCVADWRADEQLLHYWASTQAPYYLVREAAHVLGLRDDQVLCHEVGVGGGFGAKSKICDHEVLAGALSRRAGRPVSLRLTREEEYETTKTRHRFEVELALQADRDGRLCRIDADVQVENGAYDHSGLSVMNAGLKALGMLYRPDTVASTARLVDTSIVPGGQFRGYGSTQTSFALECLVDVVARELRIDPLDLRLANANRAGEVTAVGAELRSARLTECLLAVRDAIDWDAQKAARRPARGVGVAAGVHVSGSYTVHGSNRSDAAIDLDAEGRARVRFGGADAGTGQRTLLAQIAAEELGLALDAVDVLTMDSARTPFDMGAWSSRGTHYGGHAVRKAAQRAAQRLRLLATADLGEGDWRLEGGAVTNGQASVAIGELVRRHADAATGLLSVEASFVETAVGPTDEDTGRGNVSASYNFAAHAALVDVDVRTGEVTLLDYVAAHDIGTALNPIQAEGQIIGGAVMGIGLALREEVILEQGKVVNPAYLHYALPRSADVPTIRPIVVEGGDPLGPYGAKAVGECGINPPPAAIANAVYDAIGIQIRDLPITPDKILNALAAQAGRRRRHRLWARPSRWWICLVRWAYPKGLLRLLHGMTKRLPSRVEPAPLERVDSPTTLDAALPLAADEGVHWIGGGTDLQLLRRQGIATPRRLVSTARMAEMGGIVDTPDGGLEIGGAVTLAALAEAMRRRTPILAQTIDTIATSQVREMATVAGNLLQAKRCWFFRNGFGCYKRLGGKAPCYAIEGDHRFYHVPIDGHRCQATTPSDLATTLVALDAEVTLDATGGQRRIKARHLYSGPGESVLRPGELLRSVHIPAANAAQRGHFAKLKLWEGDFAVASAAVVGGPGGAGGPSRIVLGGMAPVPWMAADTAAHMQAQALTSARFRALLDAELDRAAHPLARNAWKLDAAAGLAQQAFEAVTGDDGSSLHGKGPEQRAAPP